jgi:general stress protein YciG
MKEPKLTKNGKLRGLAALSPEKRSAIGRKGGIASSKRGGPIGFASDSDWAKSAGRKGGLVKKEDRKP